MLRLGLDLPSLKACNTHTSFFGTSTVGGCIGTPNTPSSLRISAVPPEAGLMSRAVMRGAWKTTHGAIQVDTRSSKRGTHEGAATRAFERSPAIHRGPLPLAGDAVAGLQGGRMRGALADTEEGAHLVRPLWGGWC